VHATLWESSVTAYELLIRPLGAEEKERYYQETKLFAYMFGIPDEILPPSWPDFLAYNERMWRSNELSVARTARDMAAFILSPANPLQRRLTGWHRTMTAGFLPARFREAYGLAFGPKEQAVYDASLRALRATWRLLPRQYRFVPAYLLARDRIGQAVVPTLAERLLTRIWVPGAQKQAA
jgi:uncharacterized protein (DUF2236 family)